MIDERFFAVEQKRAADVGGFDRADCQRPSCGLGDEHRVRAKQRHTGKHLVRDPQPAAAALGEVHVARKIVMDVGMLRKKLGKNARIKVVLVSVTGKDEQRLGLAKLRQLALVKIEKRVEMLPLDQKAAVGEKGNGHTMRLLR